MDIQTLSEPLYRAKGWMKLVAVMMIIYGVLTALTIIGIIIAWLPIWMGVLLFQSAGQIDQAYSTNDETALATSLGKLKTYFTIMGILTLIGIVLFVVGFLLGLAGMMAFEMPAV
jgi:hypothetical protein